MKWIAILVALLATGLGAAKLYVDSSNSKVVKELSGNPNGERARKVMLLTLPSGKSLPVNYLRDGDTVYAAADFPWWRELEKGGGRAKMLVRGEHLAGQIRAERNDPKLRDSVFDRLRPTAPRFAGTLIVIELLGDTQND